VRSQRKEKKKKREEWRKLFEEEIHNSYSSINIRIINLMAIVCVGGVTNAFNIYVGNSEVQRLLGSDGDK
jgi:hypothetical protein